MTRSSITQTLSINRKSVRCAAKRLYRYQAELNGARRAGGFGNVSIKRNGS